MVNQFNIILLLLMLLCSSSVIGQDTRSTERSGSSHSWTSVSDTPSVAAGSAYVGGTRNELKRRYLDGRQSTRDWHDQMQRHEKVGAHPQSYRPGKLSGKNPPTAGAAPNRTFVQDNGTNERILHRPPMRPPTSAGNLMNANSYTLDHEWIRQTGSGRVPSTDYASAMVSDEFGNIYVTGESEGTGADFDYVTIKYDKSGAAQWTARFNGQYNGQDTPTAIAVDGAGNVYVTGYSEDPRYYSRADFVTIKYNSLGVQQWIAQYNSTGSTEHHAAAMVVDAAGNVYVTGSSYPENTGSLYPDFATVKYNSSGRLLWAKRFAGPSRDEPIAIAVDESGNVYVTGVSWVVTNDNYLTIKYSADGVEQWKKHYDGPKNGSDSPSDITIDESGSVYVTGRSGDEEDWFDVTTIKYSSDGSEEWVAKYGGPVGGDDWPRAIALDRSGNVYVTGTSDGGDFSYDFATIKYNPSGTQQWAARFDGPGDSFDEAVDLKVDDAGNVYVTGIADSVGSGFDAVNFATVKYNNSGLQQWAELYDGPRDSVDIAVSVALDDSGNVYIAGTIDKPPYRTGNSDIGLVKYSNSGDEQWMVRYEGPGYSRDYVYAMAADNFGNVYVTGESYEEDHSEIRTLKFNSAGTFQWGKRYNGPDDNRAWGGAMAVDRSGSVYVTGTSHSSVTDFDVTTIKYYSSGGTEWIKRYNGPGNEEDYGDAIAIDSVGNIYVTGHSYGEDTDYDFITIKYSEAGIQQWIARYDGPVNLGDWGSAIAVDDSGNVYVTGFSKGTLAYYGSADIATIKYDAAGVQQWVARYEGPANSDEFPIALALDGSGNVYVTGDSDPVEAFFNYVTLKYDPSGVEKWIAQYDGPGDIFGNTYDYASGMEVDVSGNVYVTGSSLDQDGYSDYVTIKYDSNGARQWLARQNSAVNSGAISSGLVLDASGNVIVTGTTDEQQVTVMYDSDGSLKWISSSHDSLSIAPIGVQVGGDWNIYVAGTAEHDKFAVTKYFNCIPDLSTNTPAELETTFVGCISTKTISVGDSSGCAVQIDSISISHPSISIEPHAAVIPAGESGTFAVRFAPLSEGSVETPAVFYHKGVAETLLVRATAVRNSSFDEIRPQLPAGWRLISLPLLPPDCGGEVELTAYRYRGRYESAASLEPGIGYWHKADNDRPFFGSPIVSDTIELAQGWNLMGSISVPVPVDRLQVLPPATLTASIYGYNGAGYFIADTISPGHAYWVKMSEGGGSIIIDSSGALSNGSWNTSRRLLEEYNSLTFTDNSGGKQSLYFSRNVLEGIYELPPLPPSNSFDVRFRSGTFVERLAGEVGIVANSGFPLNVSWDIVDCSTYVLAGKLISGVGGMAMTANEIILSTGGSGNVVSNEFVLEKAYPNPFNPSTTIRYSLPVQSHITLNVYDLLGQEVRTLVDEVQGAGHQSVEWNATNNTGEIIPSGVYIYSLIASGLTDASFRFSDSRKVLFVK